MKRRWLAALICAAMAVALLCPGAVAEAADGAPADAGYPYLERSTPEACGISSDYIMEMLDYFEEKNVEVHSLMMAVGEKVIYEAEFAPYHSEDIHVLNSLSKLMTVTATGVLVDQGRISLDDFIVDLLPEYVPEDADPLLKQLQVKHLVSMTFGHAAPVDDPADLEGSLIEYILRQPIQNEPGTKFLYDGSATQLMSAVIQKVSGKTSEEVLRDSGFLDALGIQEIYWGTFPEGFSNGAGGARMRVEDLLKIGILYKNGGSWRGQQLLSEDWCRKALGYEIVVPYEGYTGYAFHWTNKDCGYVHATGAYGQHILIDPELDLTVAFVGAIKAIPQDIPVKYIIDPTLEDGPDRSYDGAAYPALLERTQGLTLLYDAVATSSPLEEAIDGVTWSAEPNDAGVTGMRLELAGDSVDFTLLTQGGSYTIPSGRSEWTSGVVDMSSARVHANCLPEERVTTNAQWLDDATLQLTWFFTSMPYRDTVTLHFADGAAEVQLDKVTNIGDDPESFTFRRDAAQAEGESEAAAEGAEAAEEGGWSLEMTSGTFAVGRDVPAGSYSFRNTAQATILMLCEAGEETAPEQYLYGDEAVELELAEGQSLILDGAGVLSKRD